MKSRERLRDDYEEALFDVMMHDVMVFEGGLFAQENERLKSCFENEISPITDAKIKKTIQKAFEQNKISMNGHRVRYVMKTVMIAVLLMAFLFTTVYAAVPEVREITNRFFAEVFEIHAKIGFEGENETADSAKTFADYHVNYVPDGFELEGTGEDSTTRWELYMNEEAWFDVSFTSYTAGMNYFVDTENAIYDEITIQNSDAIIIEKDGQYQIAFGDSEETIVITVFTSGMDKETAVMIAENIY